MRSSRSSSGGRSSGLALRRSIAPGVLSPLCGYASRVNLFERMLRAQMRQQMLYGRRRRSGFWGPPPRRRGYGFGSPYGYGWGRPRRRTNVRVGGCCLPIPLGMMTAGALGVRAAAKRRGR